MLFYRVDMAFLVLDGAIPGFIFISVSPEECYLCSLKYTIGRKLENSCRGEILFLLSSVFCNDYIKLSGLKGL